jgi:hypothetical protein
MHDLPTSGSERQSWQARSTKFYEIPFGKNSDSRGKAWVHECAPSLQRALNVLVTLDYLLFNHLFTQGSFVSKLSANYFVLAPCESLHSFLASDVRADLQGW